ncbi:MAG: hypothetical protein FJW36_16925 [Acidobacteria bacterium]|nr:hypothetical protein [Acidobacteriota bacterium]
MWTTDSLDHLLHQLANHTPNNDPVLSGYLNRDPEGRQYFESQSALLRNPALADYIKTARHLFKTGNPNSSAFAFFIRGGQRMFLHQVELAERTQNALTQSILPSLYNLTEVRDNLDRFSLLHIRPDSVALSHHELGHLNSELSFRAPFRSESWSNALIECMRRLADRNLNQPNNTWIIAAEKNLLDQSRRLLRRRVDFLEVDPKADTQTVRRLAHSLIERSRRGQPVHLGDTPVLEALAHKPVKTLALHARSKKDLALRWIRATDNPFTFHDQAVWLAHRNRTHVEIVNHSEELTAAVGSACLVSARS